MTYTHTYQPSEPEWVQCSECHGNEGWDDPDSDQWIACGACDGLGGWMASPSPSPSITIVELP